MNLNELKQCIDSIEECADKAKHAAQAGHVPAELRRYVESLHQQASQAKASAAQQLDERASHDAVMEIERIADQAMRVCREAGNQVDPKVRDAVQRVHGEASQATRRLQAGSSA